MSIDTIQNQLNYKPSKKIKVMNVEEFESIKDFQKGFYALAKACEEKFRGEIRSVFIRPHESEVVIEFA